MKATSAPDSASWLKSVRAVFLFSLLPAAASAQTEWLPFTGNLHSWGDAANWSTGTVPSGMTQSVLFGFNPYESQIITLDGNRTLGTLTFSNSAQSFLLSGSTLTMDNEDNGAEIANLGTATNVITSSVLLADGLSNTFNVADGNLVVRGVITGSNGFTKTGEGTLWLRNTAANTYTGTTFINEGMVISAPFANTSQALGATGASPNHTVIASGATFAIGQANAGQTGITTAETFTVEGRGFRNLGAIRAFNNGAQTATISGVITMTDLTRLHASAGGELTISSAFDVNHTLEITGQRLVNFTGAVSGSETINTYGMGGLRMLNTTAGQTYSGTINSFNGEVRSDPDVAAPVNAAYGSIAALNLRNSWLRLAVRVGGNTTADNGLFSTIAPISMGASRIYIDNRAYNANSGSQITYAFSQDFGTVTAVSGHNQIGFRAALTTGSLTMNFADILIPSPSTTLQLFVDNASSGNYLGVTAMNRILNQALEAGGVDVPFLGGNVYSNAEWAKYITVGNGGHGYTPFVNADYALNTAVGTWTDTDHIKFNDGNRTITADTTINSLNIQGTTARTLAGDAGTTLTIGSGGILTNSATHVISVPFLTAGADSGYHLYNIAWATNRIDSVITDNGGNPVTLVKNGGGTTSLFGANTYTGSTIMHEGQLRDVIGSKRVALGGGNLHFAGSSTAQSTYETDRDFVRPLGSGAGEVQFTGGGSLGGGSTGFSGYGRHIQVDFGGNADPVVWGGAHFNPGVFTLNGGNSSHPVTLVNPLDLGGEQRYIRLDGNSSGAGRGAIGRIEGDIFNGGVVKRGGGTLLIDTPNTYQSGTVVEQGLVWLRSGGSLGANVSGNDIDIRSDGILHIDSPELIGSRQMIYLQNRDTTTPAAIGFGPGYGDGSGIVFNSFNGNGGNPQAGGNNVFITDSANGTRRISIQMNGMAPTSVDFPGLVKAVTAANTEIWFGATSANGVFTGDTLTPSGNAATLAWRLGSGFGTLTIEKANVLDGAGTLIVGSNDQNFRSTMGGVVYLPQPQNFTGTVTLNSIVGGTSIGNSGMLVAGSDGSLNSSNQTILLRGGELRLAVAPGAYAAVDSQYAARNLDLSQANGILRVESLGGSGNSLVELNNLRLDGADRVFTTTSSTTRQNGVIFLGTVTLNHTANASQFLDVGIDNQGFNSGFMFVQGQVVAAGTGTRTLIKRVGGTLVLMADNTHTATQIQQGNLVLTHTGAAGAAGSTITMNTNSDRNSRLYFMMDGGGTHTFDNTLTFQGGNNGSVRWVGVGPRTADVANLDTEIRINAMNMNVATSVNNGNVIFDGSHGHRLTVTGNTVMARDTRFRVRGTTLTLDGTVSGAFALNKAEFGTLVLNGGNTYTGVTTLEQGTIVAGHANAFGNAASDVVFSSGSSSQILVSGTTTIARNFINSASANAQILGGLDAGAKTFSGNVSLSGRGLNLTANGGDVNFTGTISGSGATGITKIGPGTVILNPATMSGNTYSGGTLVASGILAAPAQAGGGSAFGTGGIDLRNGALALQGLPGLATNTATTGALTISGGANLAIWDPAADGETTTMTFGSLDRVTDGTLTLIPYTGSLANEERLVFTSAPALTHGIIGNWMVAADSFTGNAGNYVTYAGGQVTTAGAYSGSGDLDGITAGAVWDAGVTGGTLTEDRSGFAFRTNANVDLAGHVLTLGGSGQAGIILNNGAGITGTSSARLNLGVNQLALYVDDTADSAVSVPVTSFRSNVNNTLTGVGFIKFGQGNLVANAGSLNGLQNSMIVAEGTLTAGAANIFPMFENLNALTGGILTIHPNATVNLNGHDQEIGNLQGIAPSNNINSRFYDTGGTLNLGGATLTVGRQGTSMVFGGQLIGGAGSTLVKVGTGDLSLTNINPDRVNSLETLQIDLGSVTTRADDNSMGQAGSVAFSLPSTTEVILRGGRWNLRSFGDGTTNQQTILVGNNVTAYGGNSILSVDRPEHAGANKHLLLGNLSIGLNNFLVTAANSYTVGFTGTTTLTDHARIQTDLQLVLRGPIDDGGMGYTLNKIGSSDLGIGADNSATWSGGFVARQGLTYLGIRGRDEIQAPGNTISGNPDANLGTGSIVMNQGFTTTTALRVYAPSNILTAQGQTVSVFGSDRSGRVRVDIGTDAPLTDYGLRSTTNGSLSFGIGDGGFYTTPLDLSMMGNGRWGISAFQTTYYLPGTLGTGVDNVYRFSGTTAALGLITPGILNGVASMEIGRSPLHVGNVPTSSQAFLRTYGDQTFTGNTTIHRGADTGSTGGIWEFHGNLATPVIENYGRLEARGDGRFVDDAGNMVNQVIIRPGSVLRFNYSMDVNDQFIISRQDNSNLGLNERKWGDDEPIFLDGAQLQITNSSGRVNQETVGQITAAGGAGIFLERSGTNGQPVLITHEGIVRQGQATLTIRNTTASELGSLALQSQKFYIEDAAWVAANRNNGMLSPWIYSNSNQSFVDYNPATETGMTNAAWTATGTGAAFLEGLTATDRANYSTAGNASLAAQVNVYAMRILGTSAIANQQINIHSGGLITNGAVTINSNLFFGDGTNAVEGFTHVTNSTLTLGGVVTAANLTKTGPSTLTLTNAANNITGNIQMNGGTLIGNVPGTFGTASITLHADYLNNNNGSQTAVVSFRTASVSGTYNNPVIVAENVPMARLDFNRSSGSAAGTITLPSLTIEGTDGAAGTLLQFEHQNSYNSAISGAVTLGGASDIGIRVNTGTTTWNGVVTATMGNLIKSGDGTLTMTNLGNDLSTGLILNRGTVVTRANTTGQTFKGNLELNFGQLIMGNTTGTAGTVFAQADQTISINGQMTLRNQRFDSTNAHMTIGADNNGNVITTSNSPWIIFQANSFGDQFNIRSDLVINDAPWIRNDSTFLRTIGSSVTSGEGKINKVGIWYFSFENTAANTYTGGTDIWAGEFMVRTTGATMGTGEVRLYPGAAIAVRNVANLGATGLTQVVTSASAFPVLSVRNNDGGNAQFDAVINAYAGANFLGNGNGIIGLGGGRNYTADLNMATRNDGMFANWWLGATEGNGTVSANSLSPWGPSGDEFRLGGAHTGTLTMNPATGGAAQLAGAGNRLVIGGGLNHLGYGTVAIGANADNTFDGGTLVQLSREVGGNSFRAAILAVQGGAAGAAWRSPLGSGQVDVHGEIRIEGAAGTAANSATTNANAWVFHPGSRIRLDNGTAFTGTGGGGRWGDDEAITLNTSVLEFYGRGATDALNTEIIGDLAIAGGSEVVVRRRGAFLAEIIAGDLTRVGSATLMVTGMDTNTNTVAGLGSGAATSAMRFKVANGADFMNNGMVDPWIIDRVGSQFMKYTDDGFAPITVGGAPANYITSAGGTLTMAANDGTEILSLGTAAATLGANLDIYALRTDRDINVSADGQFQNIIIRSGGLTQFANTPTINANLFFGAAGDGTGEALIHASNSTLQINGKIHASQVTKFGTAALNIRSDQPQFTGDWVVNGGLIQFLTPGAPSTGQIHLNGSRMNDRDSTYNITEVRFNFNSHSPDLFQWQHGKIISTGYNRIYGIAANDRQIAIGDIDLMGTGTAQEGLVTLRMDGSRSTMHTGTVKLFGHYQLNIENNLNAGGTTGGVQIGVLDNQGLYDARKAGWGRLTLGDNSTTFTNATFSIAQGGVRVLHNGSFGDATASVIVDPTGALEIAVANWVPLASLTQAWGSSERWSVDFARGAGDWTMAPGVNLQIMASQTGARTITLDGGALAGYVPIDWDQDAIIHTLGAGITLNLASDSLLGQLQPSGVANGNNHNYYDNGKLNTTTNLNPNDPGLRGSYLQILGEVTGTGGITKVGQDLILLAGANTYQGATQVDNGILQIGQANSLPTGTDLTTRFTGMFDLNGHDQEVASLQGTGGSVNNGAFDLNTLTLNQAADTTYGGQVNGNVTLVKNNTGSLTMTGVSGMRGDLVINDGSVILSGAGSVSEARSIQIGAGKVFDVSGVSGGMYAYDGKISGGGVGALRADNASRAQIIGSLSIQDGVGSISRQGSLSPGADGIGHIQVTGDLTLGGGLWGTSTKTERLTLELGAPTSTLAALGWDGSNVADWLVNSSPDVLNGLAGDLSGHDYVNVGGELALNEHGGIGVALVNGYQPQYGDVFNLLDWTSVSVGGFDAGPSPRSGGEVGYDLNLPDLTAFQLTWHTDLFASHGVIFVVPEPGRVMLLFFGLAGLLMRRRR